MEKNWERFAKVIGDSSVMSDGPLYPSYLHMKLGQQIGGELPIANHLDQSLCTSQKSNHIYYTLLLGSAHQCSAIYQPLANCLIMLSQSLHILTFLHPILLCRSHIEHCWRCSNIGTQLVWNFLKGIYDTSPLIPVWPKKTVTTSLGNTVNCKQPLFHKYCYNQIKLPYIILAMNCQANFYSTLWDQITLSFLSWAIIAFNRFPSCNNHQLMILHNPFCPHYFNNSQHTQQ
jgi:hypothetical protein